VSLLQKKSNDLHAFIDNATPLISAIQNMVFDAATTLIKHGADVNEPHDSGLVPLYYSLLLNSSEVTLALINAGADVDHIDGNGNPLLKYGCYSTLSHDAIPCGPFDSTKQAVIV
jgi:ankyrin repeat protein